MYGDPPEARICASAGHPGGVLLAAAQLAVIGWLAMVVAARYAAEEHRFDAAQLALRGARRWRVLAATSGQTGVPLARALSTVAAGRSSPDGPVDNDPALPPQP